MFSNGPAGQTSLSFSGNSYIKYKVTTSSKDPDMKIGLKIRTLQNRGVIMYRHAELCHMLKVHTHAHANIIYCSFLLPYTIYINVMLKFRCKLKPLYHFWKLQNRRQVFSVFIVSGGLFFTRRH